MGVPRALPEVLCELGRLSDTIIVMRYMFSPEFFCTCLQAASLEQSCFAPLPAETDGEASNPGPGINRPRRRGPRSDEARQTRRLRSRIAWAQNVAKTRVERDEATASHLLLQTCPPVTPQVTCNIKDTAAGCLCVWHCNIQGFISHAAELAARVRLASVKPDIICLNETFLSKCTGQVSLEGFVVSARRDRRDGRKCGGVIVFTRVALEESVTCIKDCEDSERLWLIVHACSGPLLLGCWYRPPDAGVASIQSLSEDLQDLAGESMTTLILGDINVHHERWLRFSNGTSAEGRMLFTKAAEHGLKQCVKQPTRDDHLLDLALSDIHELECSVLPKIADHCMVEALLAMPVPNTIKHNRKVWLMGAADWLRLRESLAEVDWASLKKCNPNEGAEMLTRTILEHARECIPTKMICETKTKHPWLSEKIMQLVSDKVKSHGSESEADKARACSAGVFSGYQEWVSKTKTEISEIPRGSKRWWSKTNSLLSKTQKECSVPALKDSQGNWVRDALGKADLLASTFESKYVMPDAEENSFSNIAQRFQNVDLDRLPSLAGAMFVLQQLNATSATGPDELPTRILKECADILAWPLLLLACRILKTGQWPDIWRMHWIVPLFKKKEVFKPGNYRGIHLTAQLSKAMERLLGQLWLPDMSKQPEFFGPNQFAYLPERGARDALAVMFISWLIGFQRKRKFGLYCSDVSGAFDKVDAARLGAKLRAKGFRKDMLQVIVSWLQQRSAHVVVGGRLSKRLPLANQVFQGTVWGPSLWNLFFEDARFAIEVLQYVVMVFADDLNAYKSFAKHVENSVVLQDIDKSTS